MTIELLWMSQGMNSPMISSLFFFKKKHFLECFFFSSRFSKITPFNYKFHIRLDLRSSLDYLVDKNLIDRDRVSNIKIIIVSGNKVLKKTKRIKSYFKKKEGFNWDKKYSKSEDHASFVTILFLVTVTRIEVKDQMIK